MKKVMLVFVVLLWWASSVPAADSDPCLECHAAKSPGIVRMWKESSHSKNKVGCAACHGSDVEANHSRKTAVDAEKCGSCHAKALKEHSVSKHWVGLKTGRGCTRAMTADPEQQKSCSFCHAPGSGKPLREAQCSMYLAQSSEMQRQGCESCHRVENRCDTCHTKHGTDLGLAGAPATCGTCHMGPDHAQYEMWEASTHGVIYRKLGEKDGPSCRSCHMKDGSHNVSRGIATGIPDAMTELKKTEREYMISVCAECHTPAFSRRSLTDADGIEKQSRRLVGEARAIVEGLAAEQLLMPGPAERPPHPVTGKESPIGPHMLYENLSRPEALFFRMAQFHYMSAFKGAFHQNPDYAHWFGNAPLKLALSELNSEALLLRKVKTLERRLENLLTAGPAGDTEAVEIKQRLRELKDRRLKGSISEEDYLKLKEKTLKESGL